MSYACASHHMRLPLRRGSAPLRAPGGHKGVSGLGSLRARDWGKPSERGDCMVAQSFFGVGAPEALLVGVVALVVFGPQGLIEAAKGAAATIRSFQPAIQELNQASTEIRSTITNEMGLDAIQKDFQEISRTTRESLTLDPIVPPPKVPTVQTPATTEKDAPSTSATSSSNGGSSDKDSATKPAEDAASSSTTGMDESERATLSTIAQQLNSEDEAREARFAAGAEEDPDIEKKRQMSAAMAWGNVPPEITSETSTPSTASAPSGSSSSVPKRLEDMTMAELEGELERRKTLINMIKNLDA